MSKMEIYSGGYLGNDPDEENDEGLQTNEEPLYITGFELVDGQIVDTSLQIKRDTGAAAIVGKREYDEEQPLYPAGVCDDCD
jgi:hypothetical protein